MSSEYTVHLRRACKALEGCDSTVQRKVKRLDVAAFKLSQWFIFVKVPTTDVEPEPKSGDQIELF